MRGIFNRYLILTLLQAMGLVTFIISALLFILTLLTELKEIGQGQYNFWHALQYVFLRLPNDVCQFSPLLVLLGGIVGLSMLSAHRELQILQLFGFALQKISYGALSAASLFIILFTILGAQFAPDLSYKAEIKKENLQHAGLATITASGVWYHVENNFIHVEQVIDRQLLKGVTRYQFGPEHKLQVVFYARQMQFINHQWQMHDVERTEFSVNNVKSTHLSTLNWDLQLNINLLNIGLVEPNNMPLHKLYKFMNYMQQNGIQAHGYQYNFWQRIFQPLATLIMLFLAVPFVLGLTHKMALGWRVISGILAGFVFFILNSLLGELSIVVQLPAVFAALLPLILFAGLCIYLNLKYYRTCA